MIWNISQLSSLFHGTTDLRDFLSRVVKMIARHMNASVCSIYLYDEASDMIVLRATFGLADTAVGKTTLKPGEGITGAVFREMRTIRVAKGSDSPFFKYLPLTREKQSDAFLAVPLYRGIQRLGVLVVQHPSPDHFTVTDEKALNAIAAQLSATIDSAQLFLDMHSPAASASRKQEGPPPSFLKGISVSSGVARGNSVRLSNVMKWFRESESDNVDNSRYTDGKCPKSGMTAAEREKHLGDFRKALGETETQLKDLQESLQARLYDIASLIFSAHLLMLKDSSFTGEMEQKILGGAPPFEAVTEVVQHFVTLFSQSDNPKLQEKTQDVLDLGHRLLSNLCGDREGSDYGGQIVLCDTLLPSQLFKLAAQNAAGIIMFRGGLTSHVSILARSLNIPVLYIEDTRIFSIPEDTPLLLDGNQRVLYIFPSPDTEKHYRELFEAMMQAKETMHDDTGKTVTADRTPVTVLANINLLSELELIEKTSTDGVGLYRTEFPFIIRNSFPSEEEQYRVYRKVLEVMKGREVVFRTLDVGGDKLLSYYAHVSEANPFLGLRSLRFSLRNTEIFTTQLKALLRAGDGYNLKIMFPLVASLDDFCEAKKIVRECIDQLEKEKTPCSVSPETGAMIELPCAVEILESLLRETRLVSIGTNDLIQYTLGVDRTNEAISDHYISYHPAILKILNRIMAVCSRHGVTPTLCGEIASDIRILPFLVGIGIRRFSVSPKNINALKAHIRRMSVRQAKRLARRLLRLDTIREIEALLIENGKNP
ncbi:MAG: phosphoenolpyruvate--protein phosphotransferase [Spirochaetales bacterium]|nr:phosphoenolpyruvate--protein phosphotransferase [Spirochaetales bacterium]